MANTKTTRTRLTDTVFNPLPVTAFGASAPSDGSGTARLAVLRANPSDRHACRARFGDGYAWRSRTAPNRFYASVGRAGTSRLFSIAGATLVRNAD